MEILRKFIPMVTLRYSVDYHSLYRQSTSHITAHRLCTFSDLSEAEYEIKSEKALQKLNDYFDTLPEVADCGTYFDVSYSMGVLTVHINPQCGTYVINKQSPNRQIWLSSPLSGPKRYDLNDSGKWIYKHDGISLHQLLENEFGTIYKSKDINFTRLE